MVSEVTFWGPWYKGILLLVGPLFRAPLCRA